MIASPFPSVWHTLAGGAPNHYDDDDEDDDDEDDDNNEDYANYDDDSILTDDATALHLPTIKQVIIIFSCPEQLNR